MATKTKRIVRRKKSKTIKRRAKTPTKKVKKKKATDKHAKYRNRPIEVVCAFCGEHFIVPAYRMYIMKQRGQQMYCSRECRVSVFQMKHGYPPGADCLANVRPACENKRGEGRYGMCETHYRHYRAGEIGYAKKRKTSAYWKKQAAKCKSKVIGAPSEKRLKQLKKGSA